jgi:hypothetical protein
MPYLAHRHLWRSTCRRRGRAERALYYFLTSYTTVGYGDVLPATSWRLPGPIEAAVGVLMLGGSTAIIMAAVERIDNSRSPSSEDGATHLR